MKIFSKYNLLLSLLAFLAGAQLPLAFAPFDFSILAFIAPAILLATWLYSSPRKAFLLGEIFGIGFFGVGTSWVYTSIHIYGQTPIALAILLTALFVLVLALFPALNGYIFTKIFRKNSFIKLFIGFPLTWVLFEWLRGWLFTGFPWLFLGYSQLSTPLKNIAPVFGVYGVSFGVVLTSSAIIYILLKRSIRAFIISAIIITFLWGSVFILRNKSWTYICNKPISVALIQGNIPLSTKWNINKVKNNLETYYNLTTQNLDKNLIIWPEAAIPLLKRQAQPFIDKLAKIAKKNSSTIISGIITKNEYNDKYFNSMITIGNRTRIYRKIHLVPFGEYIPLKPITKWITDYLKIPMSNLSSGGGIQADFVAANTLIAPTICYEIAYPTLVAQYFPRAQIIVTITEDSWFGHSIAAAQHLQIAQMRSLETGRYQLTATNTGITAIIDPYGKIIAKAPAFKRFVLQGKVYPMQGATPWVRLVNL